jgi:hypothetical protein
MNYAHLNNFLRKEIVLKTGSGIDSNLVITSDEKWHQNQLGRPQFKLNSPTHPVLNH